MFAAHCLPPLGNGDRQTNMSAEHDPGEGRSGSSSRDIGETPGWEDAPARTSPREDSPAQEPVEPSPGAGQTEISAAEARSRARRQGREGRRRADSPNMLPGRRERPLVERLLVRLIATCGIVAIGVAIAAIMNSSGSEGWIIGLVVSIVSVVLAAILWSSRTL
jgi:hypothetical protein